MNLTRRLCFHSLWVSFIWASFNHSSWAAGPGLTRFQPQILWVDMRGDISQIPSQIRGQWIMEESTEKIPVKHPTFHIWLRLLSGYRIMEKEGLTDSISRELNSHLTHLSFQIVDPQGRQQEMGAVIDVPSIPPLFWVDPFCGRLGISVKKPQGDARYLSASVKCELHGDGIDLYFVQSTDLIPGASSLQRQEEQATNWTRFHIKVPEEGVQQTQFLGYVRLNETGDARKVEYPITLEPRRAPKKIEFSLGALLTYFHYVEDPLLIRISEVGLSLGGGMRWHLLPRYISLDLRTFGFLLPLFVTPSGSSKAMVIGANMGFDFRIPVQVATASLYFKTGWGLRKMLVSGNAYGIQLLTGPDFTLTGRVPLKRGNSFFAFLRFAPVVNAGGFRLSNSEIGLGGGYDLNSSLSGKIWSIIGEISTTQFQPVGSTTVRNSAELFSTSLGLQVGF